MTYDIDFESQILALFDIAAKLCKASEDAYNQGGWQIFKDLLNEWVAKNVASDPYDFIVKCSSCCKVALITCFGEIVKVYLDPIFDPSTHSPQKSWGTFRTFWSF